jgi:hypothetical protein
VKGFVGVTDNDWFAYVTLLKQVWPKAQGLRHKAIRSNWANLNREIPLVCIMRLRDGYQPRP